MPTSAEAGVPSYQVVHLVRPLGAQGHAEGRRSSRCRPRCGRRFATDELQEPWNGLGAETPNLYGDEFGRFVTSEIKRWAEVVKSSGAKLE